MSQTIKIAIFTAVPIVLLVGIWIYLKNQAENERQTFSKSMEAMDEKILMIAKEKLASRQDQETSQNDAEQPKHLDKNEIEEKIRSEREEYDEFELVEPLIDLEEEEKQD